MKFEDEFLTIEQSKELKELGIDFSNANYCFRTVDFNNNPSWKYIKDDGENDIHEFIDFYKSHKDSDTSYIKTFSVAEMIEMLPLDILAKSKKYGNQTVYLSIDRNSVMYFVCGKEFERSMYIYKSFEKHLLRDSLFEMIKDLKKNNLI